MLDFGEIGRHARSHWAAEQKSILKCRTVPYINTRTYFASKPVQGNELPDLVLAAAFQPVRFWEVLDPGAMVRAAKHLGLMDLDQSGPCHFLR